MWRYAQLACGIFALLCALQSHQQKSESMPFTIADECGDPSRQSQVYEAFDGVAIKIIDGASFIIRLDDGRHKKINLIGISAPNPKTHWGMKSRRHLSDQILGRRIEIGLSGFGEAGRNLTGWVASSDHPGLPDVNMEQLRAGLVIRKDAKASLDSWLTCHYNQAEKEARVARRGLWQNPFGVLSRVSGSA